MKSKLNVPPPQPAEPAPPLFPALYKSRQTGNVVLFVGAERGVVVSPGSGSHYSLGEFRSFTPCDDPRWERLPEGESVTLSN